MRRSVLRKIPILEFKDEWVNEIERFSNTKIEYFVATEKETIDDKDILVLNFFKIETLTDKPNYRVFIHKEDYITQDFNHSPMKWRTGSLYNILGYSWYEYSRLIDNDSISLLKEFFSNEYATLEDIDILQKEIMAKRIEKKHKKIKDRIDRKMATVPGLPDDFDDWINETVLHDSKYIYYEYKQRKILKGYCTACETNVEVERAIAKHNRQGNCPNCNSSITFKATGKSRNVVDNREAAIIQKVDDKTNEIVVRYFRITKYYGADYRNPKLVIDEYVREFYDKDGNIKVYEWDNFKQTEEIRWCDEKGRSPFVYNNYMFDNTILYEKNLEKVLQNTLWEYSAIKDFATHKKGYTFSVPAYLAMYKEYPQIEYLVKLKLYKLVSQVIYYNPYFYKNKISLNGNNAYEVLNIRSKDQLRTLQRINGGLEELEVIQVANDADLNLKEDEIIFIVENEINVDRMIKILKHTTFHKAIKYANKQLELIGDDRRTIADIIRDWYDYIGDCKLLRYDLNNDFILFPKNLVKSHEETHGLVKRNKNQIYNKLIAEMYTELFKLFSWSYKNNVIIVPKSADEIVEEGHKLNHCVSSYVENVAKGDTVILFLRNKDNINKPFYTIELDPEDYKIVQCRGKNNKSMDKDIEKVINKFKKDKLLPLIHKKAA